jgi:hypothetical protein
MAHFYDMQLHRLAMQVSVEKSRRTPACSRFIRIFYRVTQLVIEHSFHRSEDSLSSSL